MQARVGLDWFGLAFWGVPQGAASTFTPKPIHFSSIIASIVQTIDSSVVEETIN